MKETLGLHEHFRKCFVIKTEKLQRKMATSQNNYSYEQHFCYRKDRDDSTETCESLSAME